MNIPQEILSRKQKIEKELTEHKEEIKRREQRISELRNKISFFELMDLKDSIPDSTPYMEIKYYYSEGVKSCLIHKDDFFKMIKENL